MNELEGVRTGSKIYEFRGYLFVKNKSRNTTIYYRCRDNECRVMAKMVGGVVSVAGEHNHASNEEEILRLGMRQDLRVAAQEDRRPLRAVYADVTQRHPHVAAMVGFPQVNSLMQRERQRTQPNPPASLDDVAEMLRGQWAHLGLTKGLDPQPFFRSIVGPDNAKSVIFASPELLNLLENSRYMHMDATFRSLPMGIGGSQVFTIHGTRLNYVFPAVYAIMQRRTTEAYEAVFRYCVELCPGLQPNIVMADYEAAMRNAAAAVWPGSTVVGCWFHYGQAVWKKHQQLGLQRTTRDVLTAGKTLKMLLCLPLLPSASIPEGYRAVVEHARNNNLLPAFQQLFGYIQEYWLDVVGPTAMSVHGLPHRTNNGVESFYRRVNDLVGRHPGFWKFLDNLRSIDFDQQNRYQQLTNDVRPVRRRREAVRAQDRNIAEAQENLRIGRYTISDFLNAISHSVNGLDGFLRNQQRRQLPNAAAVPDLQEEDLDNPLPLEDQPAAGHPPQHAAHQLPQPAADQPALPPAQGNEDEEENLFVPAPGPVPRPQHGQGQQRGQPRRRQHRPVVAAPEAQVHLEPNANPGPPPLRDFMRDEWQEDEANELSRLQRETLLMCNLAGEDVVATEGELACVTCTVHKRSFMTEPCGHYSMCGTCVAVHRRTVAYRNGTPLPIRCPVCRTNVHKYTRVYQ